MPDITSARLPRLRLWLVGAAAQRAAWIVWLLVFVGGSIRAVVNPAGVTRVYRESAGLWLAGEPLYADGIHGFLYLPHSSILSQPLLWGNFYFTEVLWRLGGIGLFVWGLHRLCRLVGRHSGVELFPLVTFVGIWPMLGCAGNGQASLHMTACMMWATVACAERRWWTATVALMLAVAWKPLAVVLILLLGAVYWRTMAWRLLVGLGGLFAAPFLLQSTAYVWRQYELAVTKMTVSGTADASKFVASDLSGMLSYFGVPTEPHQLLPVRAAAALVTAGLALVARRRWPEPLAAMWVFVLATSYLMVFNPRNESNTYAVVAPALALVAALAFLVRRRPAALLFAVLFAQATCNLYRPLLPGVQYWLKPASVLLFLGYVAVWIGRGAPSLLAAPRALGDGSAGPAERPGR